MNRGENSRMRRGVDAVRELGKPLVESPPECEPVDRRRRHRDRTEARDMVVPNATSDTARRATKLIWSRSPA